MKHLPQIKALGTRIWPGLGVLVLGVVFATSAVGAPKDVNVSLFSWPGYGFWFIADKKGYDEEYGVDLNIQIIEDPLQSFSLMSSGKLDVVSSTSEFGPIAIAQDMPARLVSFTNLSYGTDKIILSPEIDSASELKGRKVAVMVGGLQQIYMGKWLEKQGLDPIQDVEYMNLIMDDAAAAFIGGDVAAAEFWDPYGTQVLESVDGARVAAESTDKFWTERGLLADAMYMRKGFLDKDRDAAVGAMRAYWKAVHFWQENPDAGNKIIAKGLKFKIKDVERVIGSNGTGEDGGLVPYSFMEAARFCGVAPGNPPYGQENGQIYAHWRMVNDWWIRFDQVKEEIPPARGIRCDIMRELYETGFNTAEKPSEYY